MTSLRLSRPFEARPADLAAAGEFAAAVLAARQSVEVTIPRTEIRGHMRLLTHAECREVRADARRACHRLGVPDGPQFEASRDYIEAIAVMSLAIAVRKVDDPAVRLASHAEWQTCETWMISDLWQRYQALEAAQAGAQ